MRTRLSFAALLVVGAASACTAAPAPTPAPVVAAERAFAADGLAFGVKPSFLKHSADDAIVIQATPVNAHESLAKAPDPAPGDQRAQLAWWPLWAGVARSGDLGFTTGPFALDGRRVGHYFTIWKKQPDGSWKWVFDGGVDTDPSGEAPQGAAPEYLPLAGAHAPSPEAAAAEVRTAEDDLARRATTDLPRAYLAHLADDGRLHTAGAPPAKGRAAFPPALEARSRAAEFEHLGGGASQGADLVWTYGNARWGADADARHGHYVRIWQKRAEGWRIAFDQIMPPRPPRPPAPPPASSRD